MDVWVGRGENSFRGVSESITVSWVWVGLLAHGEPRTDDGAGVSGTVGLPQGLLDECFGPRSLLRAMSS